MIFKKIGKWISKQAARLVACFPTALPRNEVELAKLIASIGEIYDVSAYPNTAFITASMIMHLPPTKDTASKRFFGKGVRKLQANEAAYTIIETARKAEQAKQAATQPEITVNAPQTTNPVK